MTAGLLLSLGFRRRVHPWYHLRESTTAMAFPSVSFDLSYFEQLNALPPEMMMLRLFLDGGWVFLAWMFVQLLWYNYKEWRIGVFAKSISYVVLAIDVPAQNEQTPKAVEQIFTQLAATHSSPDWYEKYWKGKFNLKFSFEIVSIDGYVQFIVRTPVKFRDLVEAAVYAQYPDAEITEVADYVGKMPKHYPHPEYDLVGTEYVLKKAPYLPIKTYEAFEHNLSGELYFKDPIAPLLESLSQLRRGEQMWIQVLATPIDDHWKAAGEAEIAKMLGRPPKAHAPSFIMQVLHAPIAVLEFLEVPGFGHHEEKKYDDTKSMKLSPGERELVEAIEDKISKPAFNCKIRVVYVAKRNVFNAGRMTAFKAALNQYSSNTINGFKNYSAVMPKSDYPWQRWHADELKSTIIGYYSGRSGKGAPAYVLGVEELATLWHFPYQQVKAPLVKKAEAKRAEPPSALPTDDIIDHPFHLAAKEVVAAKADAARKAAEATAKASTITAVPKPSIDDLDDEDEAPPNLPFA
jgi:hypothetical protein